MDFVSVLQEELVKKNVLPKHYDFRGHQELVAMQPGDVPITYADSETLMKDYGYKPSISIRTGLSAFVKWYVDYYMGMESPKRG